MFRGRFTTQHYSDNILYRLIPQDQDLIHNHSHSKAVMLKLHLSNMNYQH